MNRRFCCLSNLKLANMLENRHAMSQTVRAEVSPQSQEWGYSLGSAYVRKVHFRDVRRQDVGRELAPLLAATALQRVELDRAKAHRVPISIPGVLILIASSMTLP